MTMATSEVQIDASSGRLHTLVQLAAQQEVDVTQLSISQLATAIRETLLSQPCLDLDLATELLLDVAILLELKARRLLPADEQHDGSADEDDLDPQAWEQRELLLHRLARCRTYQA